MTNIIYQPKSSLGEELIGIRNYIRLKASESLGSKIILLLTIYGIIFLSNIVAGILVSVIDGIVVHQLHYKSIYTQYMTTMRGMFAKYGYWPAAAYVCILGPIIEECIFRLPLSFKRNHIALGVASMSLFVVRLFPAIDTPGLWVGILLRLTLLLAIFFFLRELLRKDVVLKDRTKNVIIAISILSFGLLHIMNFRPFQVPILYLYPFYVLPQTLIGVGLTYLRLKNGIFWSIALHCINNTVSVAMMTIFLKLH